ncbi:putative Histone-lysine N-methyltransferase SUV420H14-20 [Hibiscus syriacus]|uniref:Histone-lysine N-methyltransferase SUV420H14-20 n=1 Tax=Hibiscus syriacus TaxID=106335 RepID=A0A6A3D6K6_HIBSY|nr:putative Histone-lysine N-methyltransferase SUV420H14-20 [Hibiscus syriacus]
MGGQEVKQLEECSVSKRSIEMRWTVVEYVQCFGHMGVFSSRGFASDPGGDKEEISSTPRVLWHTGTMLDIIMGISACEREHAERQMKLLEAQNSAVETGSEPHS